MFVPHRDGEENLLISWGQVAPSQSTAQTTNRFCPLMLVASLTGFTKWTSTTGWIDGALAPVNRALSL